LTAAEIGAIEITDRFSLVELPEERVAGVIAALRASTIKGKRLTERRDLAGGRRTTLARARLTFLYDRKDSRDPRGNRILLPSDSSGWDETLHSLCSLQQEKLK